jgi:hypothetical protein
MKLRIAHIDTSTRMAGVFVVQRRVWGIWNDLYFNHVTLKLQSNISLGEANVSPARFDDFHDAVKHGRAYKECGKLIIRETWSI